jgi:hypothetical protein
VGSSRRRFGFPIRPGDGQHFYSPPLRPPFGIRSSGAGKVRNLSFPHPRPCRPPAPAISRIFSGAEVGEDPAVIGNVADSFAGEEIGSIRLRLPP